MQIEEKQNRIYKPQSNTTLSAEETNQVTTELENVIIAGGLTPNAGTLTQVRDAVQNIVDTSANELQEQIDAITSASDVFDVVGTYAQLQTYDMSTVPVNDIIKVLQDETRDNAMTYYRWNGTVWVFIGSEGPYYTKSEVEADFANKAEIPTIATSAQVGLVKPDGITTQVAVDGTLSIGIQFPVADNTTIQNRAGVFSTIAVKDQNGGTAIKTWTGTKAQYDAISNKDDYTLYDVTDENIGVVGALSDLSNLSAAGEAKFDSKAGVDLSNLSAEGKELASGLCFPARTIELSLPANLSTLTAPANGWYSWTRSQTAAGYNTSNTLGNASLGLWTHSQSSEAPSVYIPARKGDEIVFAYTGGANEYHLYFIYAEGAQ